jgi:hypothetical protein
VIGVNQTAQAYLVRDLHNTVHGGLQRPAIELFLHAVSDCGIPHLYYPASVAVHANQFLRVLNGDAASQLRSFPKLDFNVPMCKLQANGVIGNRWNYPYTWGVASMNLKKSNPGDLVTRATLKSDNVTDRILPQFLLLSDILLEIDQGNEFYCGMVAGDERRKRHAKQLMEADPSIPKRSHDNNVIESITGICNVYTTNQKGGMFRGEPGCGKSTELQKDCSKETQEAMMNKFAKWKIDPKWIVLFPHVDDFNARDPGQNFLGSVSRTVTTDSSCPDSSRRAGYATKQHQTMTFYQHKVHEDVVIRETCAITIRDAILSFRKSLTKLRTKDGIEAWHGPFISATYVRESFITKERTRTNACTTLSSAVITARSLTISN